MKTIDEQYDKMVKSHQSEMKDAILHLEQEMESRNCKFGENIVPTFLKPVFISAEKVQQIAEILDHVVNILDKVTRLYLKNSDLHEFFYLDEKGAELIEIDQGYKKNVVIARPDAFMVNETMRFVEFNCDSPAGPGLCDVEEEIFDNTFPLKTISEKFTLGRARRRESLLNALLDCYHEFAGQNKKPNIAIVDWKEVRTQNEFAILQKYFKEKGYDTIIADPRDLKLMNGKLEHNGFPIDLVYRRVIFKELVQRLDDVQDFIRAYREGKVCVVNPLRSRLAANKALLAIITNQRQYKEFFTDEENRVIKKHVPWTRRVIDMKTHYEDNQVFLRKHITAHRDSLVLKPADSYGGKDVHIGHECDQVDWEILINEILKEKHDWVVQKYVDIPTTTVPVLNDGKVKIVSKKCNLNPFVFNEKYAGSMARLSDESVINVSAGGGLVPVVEYSQK